MVVAVVGIVVVAAIIVAVVMVKEFDLIFEIDYFSSPEGFKIQISSDIPNCFF